MDQPLCHGCRVNLCDQRKPGMRAQIAVVPARMALLELAGWTREASGNEELASGGYAAGGSKSAFS